MRRSSVAALAVAPLALARLLYSGPEDLYAFPKYRVTFLNDLPVLNETARHWIHDGLRGGEQEFLGEPWDWHSQPATKEIGSAETGEPSSVLQSNYSLQHMKFGPDNEFLCLIPPAGDTSTVTEDFDGDATLRSSWSLLQPLSGKCLYHQQVWFTYSYCHNYQVRQFKELTPTQLPLGPYVPTEDPEFEAFTLGRSPLAPDNGADVVVADQLPHAANLEVAHGPGSRYLVQRWGDGTVCDKTGKPREVEIQFHCSTTMADSILLVRESKICSYVLVVQTPRLCGEPGFRSSKETREESLVRCRQIIDPPSNQVSPSESTQLEQRQTAEPMNLNESDNPLHLPTRKSRFILPTPASPQISLGSTSSGDKTDGQWDDFWKRAVEALVKTPEIQELTGNNPQVYLERGENGELFIEILEELPTDGNGDGTVQGGNDGDYARLTDMLRSAIFDLKRNGETQESDPDEEDEEGSRNTRDEL